MGKLPDYADWRRPWKDGEVDEEKAARLVYNLKADLEKADDKLKEKDSEIESLTSELDEAKAAKGNTDAEDQAELRQLRKEKRELEKKVGETDPSSQKEIDRLTVALELGLSLADSKRLVGDTREELEADARTFAEEHGIELIGDENGGNDDGQNQGNEPPRRQPVPGGKLSTGYSREQTELVDPNEITAALPAL